MPQGNTSQPELALAFGTWEDTQSFLGSQLRSYSGADPIDQAGIRRRLEVLEWDCPLHYDHGLAQEVGHPSPPSPVTMLKTWAMPAYWCPGDPRFASAGKAVLPTYSYLDIPAPGCGIFATNIKTTYHADLYEGDTVTARPCLKSITRKTTSVGEGAFLVIETEYVNQHGDVVAVEEFTVFRFQPTASDA